MKTHPIFKKTARCPFLFLAPMEGVGDRPFRKAMARVGGFDEACTEFIRVPIKAHIESLASIYDASELGSMPLAAQVMGSDPELIAKMGQALEKRGAPRIDLNCGCPSNTVTGKGAGSSLLKTPELLHQIAKTLVSSVNIPVTLKMRSGYDDTSLFFENLQAAEESGIAFLTLHPRTKKDGYSAKANWDLIAEAKKRVKIPLVGNGDIRTVEQALSMLEKTSCDALMIGRGAIMDPFIFHKIKNHFEGKTLNPTLEDYIQFITHFSNELDPKTPNKTRVNKIKQILSFIFQSTPELDFLRPTMLRILAEDPTEFLESTIALLARVIG